MHSLWRCRAQFQEGCCHKFFGVQYDLSMLEMRNCHVVETTLLPEKLQPSQEGATMTAVCSFTPCAFRSAA